MIDYAVRVVQSAGWEGVAMVEFKVEQESRIPYLMEVNGSFMQDFRMLDEKHFSLDTLRRNGP
jgi:hypothetical protein